MIFRPSDGTISIASQSQTRQSRIDIATTALTEGRSIRDRHSTPTVPARKCNRDKHDFTTFRRTLE